MELAKLIKEFREDYDLTQVEAGEALDIPVGSLRDYEQGRSLPTKLALSALIKRVQNYRSRRRRPRAANA
jgi:DNA-binding transcriptional regulator YiaG